jgi:hydrogenase maturation factor HypF (carbamoyltransferase family)
VSRNEEAGPRLRGLADYFLLHNREIQTRVDDSVIQGFEGRTYPVRRSRGFAPDPVDLGMAVREILANAAASYWTARGNLLESHRWRRQTDHSADCYPNERPPH